MSRARLNPGKRVIFRGEIWTVDRAITPIALGMYKLFQVHPGKDIKFATAWEDELSEINN